MEGKNIRRMGGDENEIYLSERRHLIGQFSRLFGGRIDWSFFITNGSH